MGGGADSSEPDQFVPYAAGFTAPKVATLVDVLLASFRARGIEPRARPNAGSALATCLAGALFWTAPGVRALGVVPVPWTKTYERNLARRLLTAWRRGEQIYDTSIQCLSQRSMLGKSEPDARLAVEAVTAQVARVSNAVAQTLARWPDPSQAHVAVHDQMLQSLGCTGAPAFGYLNRLGLALWNTGFASAHFELRARRFQRIPGVNTGSLMALAFLTGDQATILRRHPLLARLRVATVAQVLGEEWARFGKCVQRPRRDQDSDHEMLTAQLCGWHRQGYPKDPTY